MAYCWGSNGHGELGIGTSDNRRHVRPVQVAGGLSFRQVSVGSISTCGVTTGNVTYCWGGNAEGELGIGTNTGPERCVDGPCSTRPVRVVGGLAFRRVRVSAGACGVTVANVAYCWGFNRFGQLDDGTTIDRSRPTRVAGGLAFDLVETRLFFTCGVTTDHAAYCWGENDSGQLGDGTLTHRLRPTRVAAP